MVSRKNPAQATPARKPTVSASAPITSSLAVEAVKAAATANPGVESVPKKRLMVATKNIQKWLGILSRTAKAKRPSIAV